MILKEISVNTVYKHKYELRFNKECWCVQEHFYSFLKNYKTKRYQKVIIELSDELDIQNKIDTLGDVISIARTFDFEKYFDQNVYGRKKMILEELHEGILFIAKKEIWMLEPLQEAYEGCLKQKLEYKWLFQNKHFLSPDGKYYGGVICNWDIDKFEATMVILSKTKEEELKSKKVLSVEPPMGEFIYYAKAKWVKNVFVLQGETKEWKLSI